MLVISLCNSLTLERARPRPSSSMFLVITPTCSNPKQGTLTRGSGDYDPLISFPPLHPFLTNLRSRLTRVDFPLSTFPITATLISMLGMPVAYFLTKTSALAPPAGTHSLMKPINSCKTPVRWDYMLSPFKVSVAGQDSTCCLFGSICRRRTTQNCCFCTNSFHCFPHLCQHQIQLHTHPHTHITGHRWNADTSDVLIAARSIITNGIAMLNKLHLLVSEIGRAPSMRTTHTHKLFTDYPDLHTIHIKHELIHCGQVVLLLIGIKETSPPQPGSRVHGQVLQQSIPPESIHACCPGSRLQCCYLSASPRINKS